MIQPLLQPQQPPPRTILTVSELNQKSKKVLESGVGSVWLEGEISNLIRASSGHWYFSLKDERTQIRCAMFRSNAQTIRFSPKEGDKVVVKGRVSLYEARGDYQLIVNYMEASGLGDLQQQLNQLMQKLQAEGLFAEQNKKNLPFLPKRIALITSPTGAAVHDVLNVLARRCPMIPVVIYPAQVQGDQAVDSLLKAIQQVESRAECDLILITRGGGSLEDLWCFNNETLANRIASLKIPVVAAIGHEIDTTITELVADLRAPTPSAAAELIVPEQAALEQRLDGLSLVLNNALESKILHYQSQLTMARLQLSDPANAVKSARHSLDFSLQKLHLKTQSLLREKQLALSALEILLTKLNPTSKLQQNIQKLAQLKQRLISHGETNLQSATHQLELKARALNALSPLSTLCRGFSVIRDKTNGKVISSVNQLSPKQAVSLLLVDGEAEAKILAVKPQEK